MSRSCVIRPSHKFVRAREGPNDLDSDQCASVARRTREIGLRTALGATPARLLADIFVRALVLVGSGVAIGNLVIVLLVAFGTELDLTTVVNPLLRTSAIMLTVGLLACIEPARRALRIHPTDALKDA